MPLSYAPSIHRDFPNLASRALRLDELGPVAPIAKPVTHLVALARERIALATESDLPEIQAWRRAFAKMGLKPTQYRCASEALLRRLRQRGDLPSFHPLIDLCNAMSMAFAIPIAAMDLDRITGDLQVRAASGTETYETFAGDIEHPEVGEIIFVDDSHRAHARRWANRQSGYSAVKETTTTALVIVEAMHETAEADIARLISMLRATISELWPSTSVTELQVR
ncbi:B3/4 domain-containing protein [Paraburkholderia sp.]|uniref:B3/B4 domain-containing protein n=1 Tax=Paraburkholderia sp. TaxID=1926495 RepID=UPI0025E26C71|nr:phenylalanine--tRNA ligase beta subunit-related protein [Paraburkholderia sp.]